MNRILVLALFIPLALLQCAIPGYMIFQHEIVLYAGHEYKFRGAPRDPYDAFRGRYVELSIPGDVFDLSIPNREEMVAYASLGCDEEGFYKLENITLNPPETDNYLRVSLFRRDENQVSVVWPFERYYMEESMAPKAEHLYDSLRDQSKAHITVYIYKGRSVITGLYIDGVPVEEKIRGK